MLLLWLLVATQAPGGTPEYDLTGYLAVAAAYAGAEACRILTLSRASMYRWQKRVNQKGLRGLEEQSRKPKHKRQRS